MLSLLASLFDETHCAVVLRFMRIHSSPKVSKAFSARGYRLIPAASLSVFQGKESLMQSASWIRPITMLSGTI
jgi:hypothetical protein